ncbi:MAG: hypothetical protein QMD14_04955 [Candidatus Aenigmarchaeota archaeon]|nr:hypothetical protein [Candidatus Aenigmarchaeota archaeon]
MTENKENLVFESEDKFNEFQKYCKEEGSKYRDGGFHLEYFTEIFGSMGIKELKNYELEKWPRVVKRSKHRFGSKSSIYDVNEWERKDWISAFPTLREEFLKKYG